MLSPNSKIFLILTVLLLMVLAVYRLNDRREHEFYLSKYIDELDISEVVQVSNATTTSTTSSTSTTSTTSSTPVASSKTTTTRSSTASIEIITNKITSSTTISSSTKKSYKSSFNSIILVLSGREDKERRKTILSTWASEHKDHTFFIVGSHCPIPSFFQKKYSCEIDKKKGFPTEAQNSTWNTFQTARSKLIANEENVIYFDNIIDSYHSLPKKLKYGYKWAIETFPDAKFFVKADDDMYLRPSALEKYLMMYDQMGGPFVIGKVRSLNVGTSPSSPNYEPDYKRRQYPPFPIGSYGHAVNKDWARYVVQNIDTLFEYQGEDTSTGIWMDEAPKEIRESIRYVYTKYFDNNGDCYQPDRVLIGHRISSKSMFNCYANDKYKDFDVISIEKVQELEPHRFSG